MSNNLVISGSIGALAQQSGRSIAESFTSADVIVIVDVSGSMENRDSRGGQSRYDVACEELAALQKSMPGKIAVVGFSGSTEFYPGGIPILLGGTTDLAGALRFVKIADLPGMKFVLISDGEPDAPDAALMEAKSFSNRIDVVYVGPEDRPSGREFLKRLAKATGGQSVTADRALELASNVRKLLNNGSV